jgi:hypothetical protein
LPDELEAPELPEDPELPEPVPELFPELPLDVSPPEEVL